MQLATHQLRIVLPLAVHAKLVLVVALRQVNDGDKVAVASHHRQRLPPRECATDEHLLATAVPLEHGRQGILLCGIRLHRVRKLHGLGNSALGHGARPLSGLCHKLGVLLRCICRSRLCVIRQLIVLLRLVTGTG